MIGVLAQVFQPQLSGQSAAATANEIAKTRPAFPLLVYKKVASIVHSFDVL